MIIFLIATLTYCNHRIDGPSVAAEMLQQGKVCSAIELPQASRVISSPSLSIHFLVLVMTPLGLQMSLRCRQALHRPYTKSDFINDSRSVSLRICMTFTGKKYDKNFGAWYKKEYRNITWNISSEIPVPQKCARFHIVGVINFISRDDFELVVYSAAPALVEGASMHQERKIQEQDQHCRDHHSAQTWVRD